jgi:hypothetical protein
MTSNVRLDVLVIDGRICVDEGGQPIWSDYLTDPREYRARYESLKK